MTVPEVVKAYREENRLGLRKFAAATGVSYQAVWDWERGKSLPAHHHIIPLLSEDDWRARFAQDVLASLYPGLIKPTKGLKTLTKIGA